jgi:hypothetical protein
VITSIFFFFASLVISLIVFNYKHFCQLFRVLTAYLISKAYFVFSLSLFNPHSKLVPPPLFLPRRTFAWFPLSFSAFTPAVSTFLTRFWNFWGTRLIQRWTRLELRLRLRGSKLIHVESVLTRLLTSISQDALLLYEFLIHFNDSTVCIVIAI